MTRPQDPRRSSPPPDLHALPPIPGLLPRAAAALALCRVETENAFAVLALERAWPNDAGRDARAFATELVLATLRWQGPLDHLLHPLLPRGLPSLEPLTRQILRIGAAELVGPVPTPPHAAVHAAVETARHLNGRSAAGLVNAVLRRLARERGDPRQPPRLAPEDALPHALPPWLHERIRAAWGPDADPIARRSLDPPTRTVRINRRRSEASAVAPRFPGAESSPWSLFVLRLPPGSGDLRDHPALREGLASTQEEGAFLVAEALPLRPGTAVLDACAGRGHKTAALAERADVRLSAADVHPGKIGQAARELRRLGLPPARTAAIDWTVGPGDLSGPFDAILLDAPCTGTGTLARRPEIRFRIGPEDVERLATLQLALLERLAGLLAPGGLLLYAVCSLLDEEGPKPIVELLARRPELHPDPSAFASPPFTPHGPGVALLPHAAGTDGFFAAVVRRR